MTIRDRFEALKRDMLELADKIDVEMCNTRSLASIEADSTVPALAKRNSGLEAMVRAFLAETGLSVVDCQLVEVFEKDRVTWYVEKRTKPLGCSTGDRCNGERDE